MVARRWRVAAATAAVIAFGLVWAGAHQPRVQPFMEPFSWQLGQALLGGLAWTLSGVVLWARETTVRLGTLMVLAGAFITISRLIDSTVPVLFTVGMALQFVGFTFLFWALLGFPRGRPGGPVCQSVVALLAVVTTTHGLVSSMFYDPALDWCQSCEPGMNLLFVRHLPEVVDPLYAVLITSLALAGGYTSVDLTRRWISGTPLTRRVRNPMIVPGILYTVLVALFHLYELPAELGLVTPPIPLQQAGLLAWVAQLILPVTFLLGLARARARRGRVADFVTELQEGTSTDRLEHALRRTLGDPSLEVVYLTQAENVPELPGRATTVIEGDHRPLAALLHDPVLLEDARLLEATTAAAKLAIENAKLAADLRDQLAEVRASRSRIVQAGDEARRRVERDLHDGAQQRLVSLSLLLRQARGQVNGSPILDEAVGELEDAMRELRDLARGVYPLALAEGGLAAALDGLAERASVPAVIGPVPDDRLPEPVEAAAYFVASEAITNAAKHAGASSVRVAARQADGRLVVEVADDGVGGAAAEPGGGLRGLQDRVEALDGLLTITSPPGGGTTVRAELPCASS